MDSERLVGTRKEWEERNDRLKKRNPNLGALHLPLSTMATHWPTPDANVMNDGEPVESFRARRERIKAQGINGNGMGTPLAMFSQMWPSPRAEDSESAGNHPDAVDSLTGATKLWATPRAASAEGTIPPTSFLRSCGKNRLDDIRAQTIAFRLPPTTAEHGTPSSDTPQSLPPLYLLLVWIWRESSRGKALRLNPSFVEWLMGWPIGHSDSERPVTVSCLWWRESRSRFLYLKRGLEQPGPRRGSQPERR